MTHSNHTIASRLLRVLLALALLLPLCAGAQRWNGTVYDFGTIEETGGPKGGRFTLVNDTDSPLTILKVKTSCGCTAASYEEAPIAVGDTASVTFAYDPARRPGRFEKSIRVYFQQGDQLSRVDTLHIRGNVIPDPQTLNAQYPVVVGPLRLATKLVDMGKVKRGVARHSFIQVFNTSADSIVAALWTYNEALTATQVPEILAPGQAGIISLQLDATKETRDGEVLYELLMQSGDKTHAFPVRAEIAPDTAQQSTVVGHQNRQKHFPKTYTQSSGQAKEEVKKEEKAGSDEAQVQGEKEEGKKKKKLFPKTYTEVKKVGKEKKKKKLFSKTYTEVKKKDAKEKKLFPKTYTEVKKESE